MHEWKTKLKTDRYYYFNPDNQLVSEFVSQKEAEAALAEAETSRDASKKLAEEILDALSSATATIKAMQAQLAAAEGLAGIDGDDIPALIAGYKARIAALEKQLTAAEAENEELDAWFRCLSEPEWFDDAMNRIAALECEIAVWKQNAPTAAKEREALEAEIRKLSEDNLRMATANERLKALMLGVADTGYRLGRKVARSESPRPDACPSGCHYMPDKEDCPKDCFYLKPKRKRGRSK